MIRVSWPHAGEFGEAADMYREVLRSSEEHKDRLKTDSLQVPLFFSMNKYKIKMELNQIQLNVG